MSHTTQNTFVSTTNAVLPAVGAFVPFTGHDDDDSTVLTDTTTLFTGRTYLFTSRGVWVEVPGEYTDTEIEAITDARYRPEGRLDNNAAWSLGKIGIWEGTQAAYDALSASQRAPYHYFFISG